MITVRLYGDLQQYGRRFYLSADTPAEALYALFTQIRGLKKQVSDGLYQVRWKRQDLSEETAPESLHQADDGVLHVVPRVAGAGKVRQLVAGVALIAPDGRKKSAFEKTTVTFRAMTREELSAYVASGESLDKAGAYAIQDKGALLVEKINGCYFNVVGLPIQLLSKMFSDMGWPLSEQWGK